MAEDERLSVRLSSDYLTLLKELVFTGKYSSESDAVQDAVRMLIESCYSEEERAKIISRSNGRKAPDLGVFTSNGSDGSSELRNIIVKGLNQDCGGD